ncbi:MAG: 16S rRNA (uracil(1498)-N(3))-methyltransferase [Deltaproteobacteria bacterium]|nr:16S rRNA (uracil(1498)-N(3))-methyltransferase [Deltaproteobacteria bacterium]
MPRIYVPPERIAGEEISLQSREARYILTVLRLNPGDEVTVFDGEGREYRTELSEDYDAGMYLAIQEELSPQRESPLRITLGQALLKGERMKFVIQKATELGVDRIIPLLTSRSVPIVEGERESLRRERWRRIAQEAAKQSGRTIVPEIEAILELADFFAQGEGARVMLWEDEPTPLREIANKIDPHAGITLLIGPEGGFSEAEVTAAQDQGFLVAGLGQRVLRAETATLSVLSIIQHLFGDLG